jgi:urea carboxylase-associated protein 2
MTAAKGKSAAAEINRRRYEELRAAGQGATLALPAQTLLASLPIPADATLHREEVPDGWYTTTQLLAGEMLRVVDVEGSATPALVAWRQADPSERISLADTIKVQWTAALRRGRIILSDMGRVMLSIVEDTSGAHDALMGGSAPGAALSASDQEAPATPFPRNTRENLLIAAQKLGLERRDIPSCLSLFAPVSVDLAGRFQWEGARKRPGDFVDLRAEMDLLVAVSNCPHPLHPSPRAGPIEVIRHRGRSYERDPCRNSGPEVIRAFHFTEVAR